MAYTPKTWQCDDTITADELNRMEQGIAEASQSGGGTEPLIVNVNVTTEGSDTVYTLDKTWQEIYDAFPNVAILTTDGVLFSAVKRLRKGRLYEAFAESEDGEDISYIADEASGYPSFTESGN